MDRTLKRLKEAKGPFSQVLETLEADPICCGMIFYIFVLLVSKIKFVSFCNRIKHSFIPDVANATNHSSPFAH